MNSPSMAPAATCGCCAGTEPATPASVENAPGLDALAYRVGRHATFLETMLARLGTVAVEVSSPGGSGVDTLHPLAALTTRDLSDPAIALLDAWAVVADLLAFYQERIANEGYLPTAVERRSLVELARLVAYRPRPGVAAGVKLAITVAAGFDGTLPAGTRAQSMPPDGSPPQFYETSRPLPARADWNTLAPRLARPQVITPAGTSDTPRQGALLVTGADVIDTVYLDGIATQLKAGDGLFLVFGTDTAARPQQQYLRLVTDVQAQADANRTQLLLGLEVPPERTAIQQALLYADKGRLLYASNALASTAVEVFANVANNLDFTDATGAGTSPRQVVQPGLARLALLRETAVQRGFTRLAGWLTAGIRSLQWIGLGAQSRILSADITGLHGEGGSGGQDDGPKRLSDGPSAFNLASLVSLVAPLTAPASRQPANAQRLVRSVASSFQVQSDVAPQLLSALHGIAPRQLYPAWHAVSLPGVRLEAYAARIKATLFAASWSGPPTSHVRDGGVVRTSYTAPTIGSAWPTLVQGGLVPTAVPLDGAYEQIKPGSWVAIRRPGTTPAGTVTFHTVVTTRTTPMSTRTGFSARSTVLVLEPPWLSELTVAERKTALRSRRLLTDTLVYAQAEAVALAEEPVDDDVGGASVDLAGLVQGLQPGRWVIVGGRRSDVAAVGTLAASELAMVAGVRQGIEAPGSVAWPLEHPPFAQLAYVTDADAYGDRLVVGRLSQADASGANPAPPFMAGVGKPAFINQLFADQVELAPGYWASPYVPTEAERAGIFPSFDGLLVDPVANTPYPNGTLDPKQGVFAWRVTTRTPHTILDFAAPLANTYDRGSVTINANVVEATHGYLTGQVLGNGDATAPFATFALGQSPLTWVPAATTSGIASTLQVRVNELEWHELPDFSAAGPGDRVFVTREDDDGVTSVIFGDGTRGARPPTGTANLKASFRFGIGRAGNCDAGLISQLANRPLGAQGVSNPLPATGGADPDGPDRIRAQAPLAVMALDRLVSVRDYADFARVFAGIGKAAALKLDDRGPVVHVTVAGVEDVPIDPGSDLLASLLQALRAYGDPTLSVVVAPRRLRLLVMAADIALQPDFAWEDVQPRLAAALHARFAFDARELAQTAYLSEAVATAQGVAGVSWVRFTHFDSVGQDVTAAQLADLASTLALNPFVQARPAQPEPATPGTVRPAELVYLSPAVPATLTLGLRDTGGAAP